MALKNGYETGLTEEQIEGFLFAIRQLSVSITPYICPMPGALPQDATGGHVGSLTEAVMGVTSGLCKIAEAIDGLSEAVRVACVKDSDDDD